MRTGGYFKAKRSVGPFSKSRHVHIFSKASKRRVRKGRLFA